MTNLRKSNIKLYVDGKRKSTFKYNRSTDRLYYAAKTLGFGAHQLKIVGTDTAGNVTVKKWSFKVVK